MASFRYLQNEGSPTNWDGTRYFDYLKRARVRIPADLRTITEPKRYDFDRAHSFWHSRMTNVVVKGSGEIELTFLSDNEEWLFGFNYSGVARVSTNSLRLYFMPSLVMQELVVLRGDILRHALSDLGGDIYVIHASNIHYWQSQRM